MVFISSNIFNEYYSYELNKDQGRDQTNKGSRWKHTKHTKHTHLPRTKAYRLLRGPALWSWVKFLSPERTGRMALMLGEKYFVLFDFL